MITPEKYIRKPLYVDVVQLTIDNFEEVAAWCMGEILDKKFNTPVTGSVNPKKCYVKVRVHNPKNVRQTRAFVGDWLLYTERGYKVYTDKAFNESFDPVNAVESTPHADVISSSESIQDAVDVARMEEQFESATRVTEPIQIPNAVDENGKFFHKEPDKVEPTAAEGKRVLSLDEQGNLTSEEIRELIQSGEVVLAQDIATP